MRLRTKLVLTASALTFAIVFLLSVAFLGEMLRQRVEQTYTGNDVLAKEVRLATLQAVKNGLTEHPPVVTPDSLEDPLHAAVLDALRSDENLQNQMNGIIRYSLTVEDVSVTDEHGFTMISTDPDALNQRAPYRTSFDDVRNGNVFYQMREVFGKPKVLDISEPIERNGVPFLIVHVGVRSSFLSAVYGPWLHDALEFALLAILASVIAAALLSTVALRPLQAIGDQLEQLALPRGHVSGRVIFEEPLALEGETKEVDPVGRVSQTINRLGREMQVREEGYTALRTNLDQMLDTLRDGVLLFDPERRAVMVSDAVAHFIERNHATRDEVLVDDLVGKELEEIFPPDSMLGEVILAAFERGAQISAETVALQDGRQVQISLDRIRSGQGGIDGGSELGTLLTLRDTGSAQELEQELEVSRRLAAIGRLTANVGHEVKNPINAMVVHLELLRSKLASDNFERGGAQKHVDILADEMHRLDRVVQTLADFSRPMELDLREHDLRKVIEQTLELAGEELKEHGVVLDEDVPVTPIVVRVDAELMRQALLNLLLNAMQAMPSGGRIKVKVGRDQRMAVVEIADNGVGIPAPLLPRIFDLYFTTKPKGSGIGLAMTYRIVQLHGGTMDVRSDANEDSPARGTTFTLQLPISAPGSDGHPGQRTGRVDANGTSAKLVADTSTTIAANIGGKEIS